MSENGVDRTAGIFSLDTLCIRMNGTAETIRHRNDKIKELIKER